MYLAEPPNLFVKNYADKVDKPYEWRAEEKHYGQYDTYYVICVNALDKTVDRPNNVQCRNAKNKLCDKREIVKCLDNFFHNMPPKKFLHLAEYIIQYIRFRGKSFFVFSFILIQKKLTFSKSRGIILSIDSCFTVL